MKKIIVATMVIAIVVLAFWFLKSSEDNLVKEQEIHLVADQASEIQQQFTYLDILNNPEFVQQMQQAVRQNDMALAQSLQAKAIQIGNAAGLPENEMKLLEGERGLDLMFFLAKRQIFWQEFESYYADLKDISLLKKLYPEAQDLFPQADKLIKQRDENLRDIAASMAGDEDIEPYLEQAKKQWKENAVQQ